MIENLRLRPLSTPYGVASSNSETFEKTLDGEAPIFIEISKDSDSDIYRFCQFLYIRIVFSPFITDYSTFDIVTEELNIPSITMYHQFQEPLPQP